MHASELRVVVCCAAAASLLAAAAAATAQTPPKPAGAIYSCTTADGRRLTSDRPIVECSAREQRVLNADGSLRTIVPPSMSPEERAVHEANERRLSAERAAKADAIRRDRNLMTRYRSEAQHQKAREAALDDVNKSMRISEKRIEDLTAERKPLLDEAEFYQGKQFPAKLRLQLDANEASTQAQRELIENQKAELVRVNKLFDVELARLRKLWAGATPGSID